MRVQGIFCSKLSRIETVKRFGMFLTIFLILTATAAVSGDPQKVLDDLAFVNIGSFSKR